MTVGDLMKALSQCDVNTEVMYIDIETGGLLFVRSVREGLHKNHKTNQNKKVVILDCEDLYS
jgi:hypothetical protein